jgi:hypothetical protein
MPWPIKLGCLGVLVTVVAWMAAPTTGTILGLLVMWVVLVWVYARWERKEGERR